ncbi:uncharacterized protein LOC62_05G007071 [Vanrija pseudolonga]|uniref:Uncharacterized protein n=1 Tax=Vanrija pseudolonga TaxID=143232 RepID=A0AAF0YB64_9TREE|nr:hypothetical protein LOC62_05G007071 [Vanrija pseudolonga]
MAPIRWQALGLSRMAMANLGEASDGDHNGGITSSWRKSRTSTPPCGADAVTRGQGGYGERWIRRAADTESGYGGRRIRRATTCRRAGSPAQRGRHVLSPVLTAPHPCLGPSAAMRGDAPPFSRIISSRDSRNAARASVTAWRPRP